MMFGKAQNGSSATWTRVMHVSGHKMEPYAWWTWWEWPWRWPKLGIHTEMLFNHSDGHKLHPKPALIVIQCVRDRQQTKQNKTNTDKKLKRSYTTDEVKWNLNIVHVWLFEMVSTVDIDWNHQYEIKVQTFSFTSKSWRNVQELLLFFDICAPYSQDRQVEASWPGHFMINWADKSWFWTCKYWTCIW